MGRLDPDLGDELDARLAAVDLHLSTRYPGDSGGRQPVHTVYVPADRWHYDLVPEWGAAALAALEAAPALPYPRDLHARVTAKLAREPIEDLRIDFEDGYGIRPDDEEDAAAGNAAKALLLAEVVPPFLGVRVKSMEAHTRKRALRTLDGFLEVWFSGGATRLPETFVVTLPKVSDPAQVAAFATVCGALEAAYGIPAGDLRFEIQIETPPAILGADGTATVARMITEANGRCAGLHYGTYDYSAAAGIGAAYQSMDHPAADHAKAVMQVAAAGTGVRLSDGSTNILPVGTDAEIAAAWALHARLVRRSLERGFYQGWDLHAGQLPTRYAATYGFFRDGAAAARDRLAAYLGRRETGILDEPATARALAGFLLRGLRCGALDPDELGDLTPEQLSAL